SRAVLKVGSRGSALATAQARTVVAELPNAELVVVESSGSPSEDKARWTRSLDQALLDGEIDIAIHSAKDVPGDRPDGIVALGVPKREDPRDAICGAISLEALSEQARVGTSSPRRAALIAAFAPQVQTVDLRGNVDTRLRKLAEGECDAAILALAGLRRLGLADKGIALDPTVFTPAPGQGSLLLEGRVGDDNVRELGELVSHRESELALAAERSLVIALGADCHTAVGALAQVEADLITLDAICLAPDGATWIRDRITGPVRDAAALGRELAKSLRAAGADELLALSRGEAS
ncbi:MAG: hydroxymethylbilane synthase, partial [Actinomycetes bacterium]